MAKPDYQSLIDAETWEFIRASEAAYPPETASLDVAGQRRIYDTMCRGFFQGYPGGVTSEDRRIAGVACRVYPGAAPSVIYLHGGGFVVGGLHSHDDVCAEIRHRTGLSVIAVDYRLSPEHLHPAALEDALAVVRFTALAGPVVLAGDSAGGNLAAAVSGVLRGSGMVLGQVLIYAGLGGDIDAGSYIAHAFAPMLTREDVVFYAGVRFAGGAGERDASAAPLQDSSFAGLPPTVAICAECDPVADDSRHYARLIAAAGGRAHWLEEPGLVHGYLRARGSVARAAASFGRICDAITALAAGEWPYGDCR